MKRKLPNIIQRLHIEFSAFFKSMDWVFFSYSTFIDTYRERLLLADPCAERKLNWSKRCNLKGQTWR